MSSYDDIYEFNLTASCTTPEEFISNVINVAKNIQIENCIDLVNKIKVSSMQWNNYKKSKLSAFHLIQNYELISFLFYTKGYCAETILTKTRMVGKANPDTMRGWLNMYFRSRTESENIIRYNHHIRNRGLNNTRPDLFGFEDEVIRLYKCGMSSERISVEFNCDARFIVSILKKFDAFDIIYQNNARQIGWYIATQTRESFSDEKRSSIISRTLATRIRNNSHINSRTKYISTIRKKYNDPTITNVSQVSIVHEKQQRYRYYSFSLPSGRTINIQGYEKYAINILLKSYSENDLNFRQCFWYTNIENSKRCRYFADIYIPATNEVIEVKSVWTIKKYAMKNYSILLYMLQKNIKFAFWVFDEKQNLKIISSIQDFLDYIPNFSQVIKNSFANPDLTMSSDVNLNAENDFILDAT